MEMFRAFNMGVGMVVITSKDQVSALLSRASSCGIEAWELGSVVKGTGEVRLEGLSA